MDSFPKWDCADGHIPFDVQKQTATLAINNHRCYILNDMGTGKTRAALLAWRHLYRTGVAKKLLVIAPLSTLSFVWAREVSLVMPDMKVAVLHKSSGGKAFRLKMLETEADIYIINHDGLKVIASELYARSDIDTLILDELAVYRNRSQRNLLMQRFAKRFKNVWGMTGRPMPNAPTDVFYQCKIITPQTVPQYFRHAQTALMRQVDMFKWVPKPDAIDTALDWMQPSIRFSLDDVVELPEAIYRTLDIDMSDLQAKVYRRLANEFVVMIEEKRITAANAAVAMGKLLQVGCGYVYTLNPEYVTLDSEPRQSMLLELLSEAPHKVIVFAPWKHLIANLSTLLTTEKIDHAVVHGETKNRETIFDAFQRTTQYRVLLAHPQCIHHGVTLTAATTVIWYSPIPSLEVYEQANARIRRISQKRKQLFIHLQATSVERKVYALLRTKQRLQDQFLELLKSQSNE